MFSYFWANDNNAILDYVFNCSNRETKNMKLCSALTKIYLCVTSSDIIEGILAKFTWFFATIPFSINEPICITKPFAVNSYVGWTISFILVLARSFAKFARKFASISTRIGYKPILFAKSVTINSYIVWTKSLIFILALNVSISQCCWCFW